MSSQHTNHFDVEQAEKVPLNAAPNSSGPSGSLNIGTGAPTTPIISETQQQLVTKFLMCFVGLQASYLTWGYMQELIMTTQFAPTVLVPKGLFPSATFCVFSNRLLAVALAIVMCKIKHGKVDIGIAGWTAFAPCSFSNTVSSWAQYGESSDNTRSGAKRSDALRSNNRRSITRGAVVASEAKTSPRNRSITRGAKRRGAITFAALLLVGAKLDKANTHTQLR